MLLSLWILLLLLLFVVTFIQGIHNSPEVKHVSSTYYVAAILRLQYMVRVMLCPIKMFYTYHHHHHHHRRRHCLKVKLSLSMP